MTHTGEGRNGDRTAVNSRLCADKRQATAVAGKEDDSRQLAVMGGSRVGGGGGSLLGRRGEGAQRLSWRVQGPSG